MLVYQKNEIDNFIKYNFKESISKNEYYEIYNFIESYINNEYLFFIIKDRVFKKFNNLKK
jgi:hypothetical protein